MAAPTFDQIVENAGVFRINEASGGFIELKMVRVPLTDAQVKALPSASPYELMPAPGAGKRIVPLLASLKFICSGAYTNINAAAFLALQINGADVSSYVANDAGLTPAATDMTDLFGQARTSIALLTPLMRAEPSWFMLSYAEDATPRINQPLDLNVDNGGSGDFTGGNAANSGQLDILVAVI